MHIALKKETGVFNIMKQLLKRLFGKKNVKEIKETELISGVEYDRLEIAIGILRLAWEKGLNDFQVTYKPEENFGVSGIKMNELLSDLDNYTDVEYTRELLDEADATKGIVFKIKR